MATVGAWHLVLDHLFVGNQLEERLNAKREKMGVNTTQMLVLALLEMGRARSMPLERPSDLARELHLSRPMISIQLKGLVDEGLVEAAAPRTGDDRRARRFRVTAKGAKKAKEVQNLLDQLFTVLHVVLRQELHRPYGQALRRIAEELQNVPPIEDKFAAEKYRADTRDERKRAKSTAKKRSASTRSNAPT